MFRVLSSRYVVVYCNVVMSFEKKDKTAGKNSADAEILPIRGLQF